MRIRPTDLESRPALAAALAAAAFVAVGGCVRALPASPAGPARSAAAPKPAPDTLQEAEALYGAGRVAEALRLCVDLARLDPPPAGLADLQQRVLARLALERETAARQQSELSMRRMTVDVEAQRNLPDTLGLRRTAAGETASLRTEPSAMEAALGRKITCHLDGVTMNDFILAMGSTERINIVADSNLQEGGTMTVHADDVPLKEVLDFVSRNLGVRFFVGENIVWATRAQDNESRTPMETRMYRLRKGLAGKDLEDTQNAENSIVATVKRFVPLTEGADLLFDPKSHLLIARHTREKLAEIERLVEKLDIAPAQVQIEARFITTAVTDLRELGVDWLLNSPVVFSTRAVTRDGVVDPSAPRTQIADGASVSFPGFPNSAQGLNFAYQGLLTDPMFQAVIHALETSGKSRTLSVPKVTTLNNRPARIREGEDFLYFEEYDVQSIPANTASGGNTVYQSQVVPVGRPTKEELGISLEVTPSVGADLASVALLLKPEISQFIRFEEYRVADTTSNNGAAVTNGVSTNVPSLVKLPIFARREIETEVVVRSGETVVMGGLISSTEQRTRSGIPFLSSLPLIGALFTREGVEEKKQNLLIFVTATILSERGESLVPVSEITLRRRR